MSDARPPAAGGEEPGPTASQSATGRRRRSRLIDLAAVGALLILLAYLHTRVVQVVFVGTRSMAPTIEPGDRMLVHLSAYRKHAPRRGDIIAFRAPDGSGYEVKRVIAVGGDTIVVGGGVVFLNGKRLKEPYVPQPMVREFPVGGRLAADELWVMGDNRNDSEDSRDFGPIRRRQVMGRLFYRLWPPDRIGRL